MSADSVATTRSLDGRRVLAPASMAAAAVLDACRALFFECPISHVSYIGNTRPTHEGSLDPRPASEPPDAGGLAANGRV